MACIDSTPLAVCHNRRLAAHQVCTGWAARGKTSMGGFSGVTLHVLVNDEGALLACCVTPGQVDERRPVPQLAQTLWGQLVGDRGSISPALHDRRWTHGLALLTTVRQHRKHRLMRLWDKLRLRKRPLLETLHEQWKHIRQMEPSSHRSVTGCMVNLLAGLVAYSYQPKKPSLGLRRNPMLPVLMV
jgi:hypothetical protein